MFYIGRIIKKQREQFPAVFYLLLRRDYLSISFPLHYKMKDNKNTYLSVWRCGFEEINFNS